ncbi:MAG: immunity 51 family protein [Ruminococcus sp.]|nr:immunity 51 family protein [Ruminococcus sp.]
MNDILPFTILDLDGSYSLILASGSGYLEDIFETRADEGLLPNGYGWEALAMAFIENCCPEYEDLLDFDSEAGMFCAYSKDEETLKNFAAAFKAACDDREKITDILSKADPDNF